MESDSSNSMHIARCKAGIPGLFRATRFSARSYPLGAGVEVATKGGLRYDLGAAG